MHLFGTFNHENKSRKSAFPLGKTGLSFIRTLHNECRLTYCLWY